MYTFSAKAKELRKNAKLTQKQLAHEMGAHTSQIAYWENRVVTPYKKTLYRYMKYFKVAKSYFDLQIEIADNYPIPFADECQPNYRGRCPMCGYEE